MANGTLGVQKGSDMGAMVLNKPKMTEEVVYNTLLRNQLALSYLFCGQRNGLRGGNANKPDLYEECGYEAHPDFRTYHDLYVRGGIARRVVDIWPDECWAAHPEMYETEDKRTTKWERAWNSLVRRVLPWHFLHRADRLSGIGRFGVMLLGFNDGKKFSYPAPNIDPDTGEWKTIRRPTDLVYLRAFDESLVTVTQWETDQSNPRYGQPREYSINFAMNENSGVVLPPSAGPNPAMNPNSLVHWSRVVHLADNRMANEILAIPRLEPVLNLISDIHKVQGGSAEMFWKGGFPGYAFEALPNELGTNDIDITAIKEEVAAYTRGLQRFLTSENGSWKSLAVQVADPRSHVEQYVAMMCATIGVPTRIFLGSEAAHLASTQDATAWKERIQGRRRNYLEPMVIDPFVQRLMAVGVLPRVDQYHVSWQDPRVMGDKDRADVALKQVQALMQYVQGGVNNLLPERFLWTMLFGLTEAQADAVEKELKANPPKPPVLPAPAQNTSQSGGRKGTPNKKPTGRPKNGPPEGQS